jgi:hypothetical protein
LFHFERKALVPGPRAASGLTRKIYLVRRQEGSLSAAAQALHDLVMDSMKARTP